MCFGLLVCLLQFCSYDDNFPLLTASDRAGHATNCFFNHLYRSKKKNTMKTRSILAVLTAILLFPAASMAQKTWNDIYTYLGATCGSSFGSCHGPAAIVSSFNISHPPAQLYDSLLHARVVNPHARTAGYRLIDPFSPHSSFLLRKLSRCADGALKLAVAEGDPMPQGDPNRIPDEELELIFNWILQGASDTSGISPDTVAGDICDLPLAISIPRAEAVFFALYPNPASTSFSCSYWLEQPASVTMALLDVTGKNVKTVFTEYQGTGRHQITVNPGIVPGIYFIRLNIGTAGQYVQKVVLH